MSRKYTMSMKPSNKYQPMLSSSKKAARRGIVIEDRIITLEWAQLTRSEWSSNEWPKDHQVESSICHTCSTHAIDSLALTNLAYSKIWAASHLVRESLDWNITSSGIWRIRLNRDRLCILIWLYNDLTFFEVKLIFDSSFLLDPHSAESRSHHEVFIDLSNLIQRKYFVNFWLAREGLWIFSNMALKLY